MSVTPEALGLAPEFRPALIGARAVGERDDVVRTGFGGIRQSERADFGLLRDGRVRHVLFEAAPGEQPDCGACETEQQDQQGKRNHLPLPGHTCKSAHGERRDYGGEGGRRNGQDDARPGRVRPHESGDARGRGNHRRRERRQPAQQPEREPDQPGREEEQDRADRNTDQRVDEMAEAEANLGADERRPGERKQRGAEHGGPANFGPGSDQSPLALAPRPDFLEEGLYEMPKASEAFTNLREFHADENTATRGAMFAFVYALLRAGRS